MTPTQLHPNTQTLLSAWQRMSGREADTQSTPQSDDHPDILAALFVIERNEDGLWLYRNAGAEVCKQLGRDPVDHNFLEMWRGYDRIMTGSIINAVVERSAPAILQAWGHTLRGQDRRVEITLASISEVKARTGTQRLIGLYQVLDGSPGAFQQPAWGHKLEAIYPPQADHNLSHLRLVASND